MIALYIAALIICILFVVYYYWTERKASGFWCFTLGLVTMMLVFFFFYSPSLFERQLELKVKQTLREVGK